MTSTFEREMQDRDFKRKFEESLMIKSNKAQCKQCGTLIESKTRHDFVFCKCGAIAVDGGKDYLRRIGNEEDIIDLSEFEEDE